jgi:IS30 family transposase
MVGIRDNLDLVLTNGDSLNITDEQIKAVADKLNNRPRRCLESKTPYEVFYGKILEAG